MVGRILAATGCALLTATLGVGLADPAIAATTAPSEVRVVPADRSGEAVSDLIYWAGRTGFLHQLNRSDSALLWTRYADHVTTPVGDLRLSGAKLVPAGGDVATSVLDLAGHTTPGFLNVLNLADMTAKQVAMPTAGTYVGYYGATMLVADHGALSLRRFAADGSSVDVPATGVPDGTTAVADLAGDADTAVLRFTGSPVRYGLLDLASAAVTLLPADLTTARAVLSGDHVGFVVAATSSSGATVRTFSRTGTDEHAVPISGVLTNRIGLVGGHVIGAVSGAQPVVDFSTGETVLPQAQTDGLAVGQGADGIVIAGAPSAGQAVHRFTAEADGVVERTPVLSLPLPLVNAGLVLSRGVVRHVQAYRLPGEETTYQVFDHELTPTSTTPNKYVGTLVDPLPCEPGAVCAQVSAPYTGTRYLAAGGPTSVQVSIKLVHGTSSTTGPARSLPSASARIVDAASGDLIVNGTGPDQQYIVPPVSSDPLVTRPVTGAVFGDDGLWTATGPGVLQQTNVTTGAVVATAATGAACTAGELQAASHYVYWTCGADGPAGVYDTTAHTDISAPADHVLLGDGYLVRHAADGVLQRYDISGGALCEPVSAGSVPRGTWTDDRGITWAVDKFGGDIAYVDAAGAVHIVEPGVPRSPLRGLGVGLQYGSELYYGNGWSASVRVSRPITGSTLTITRASTGQVAVTNSHGPNDTDAIASWDGYLLSGGKAFSGLYRYTITATTSDNATPVTVASGSLTVHSGTPNVHSYDEAGSSGVLAVLPTGESYWLIGDPGGQLRFVGPTDNKWTLGTATASQVSALTPFGDFNGDGKNDLLARDGTGVLHAYPGYDNGSFSTRSAITIGKGWTIYNLLVSPGDLNGDGHADLLGRDAAGKLWRYYGTATSSLSVRSEVPGSFTAYPKIVGPGDLDGDGRVDLIGVDTAGTMSFALGNGVGGFGAWQRIGGGWGTYAVAAAGDLNQDGRNDLAARDSAGVLWLYPGTGNGSLGVRTRLGSGYQQYAVIA